MQIECPFCNVRAQLPDHQEGARVRCGSCQKLYRARDVLAPAPRRAGGSKSAPWIAVFAVAALILLFAILSNKSSSPGLDEVGASETSEEVATPTPAPVDPTGWDSEAVRSVRDFCQAISHARSESLQNQLHGPLLFWNRTRRAEAPAAEPFFQLGAKERADALLEADQTWSSLEGFAKREFLREMATLLCAPEHPLANLTPYDGEVVSEGDRSAEVRTSMSDPEGESRTWAWTLVYDQERWQVGSLELYFTEADRKREQNRGVEKVTLRDGSKVLEKTPEPLEHLDDTPPALRSRIDSLFATMINLDLTTESGDAKREIIAIGKPAIPILLTGLYENKLETQKEAIQANIVVLALRDITGQFFGYKPQALVGSSAGTTEERRMSSIRQWFAWWWRNRDTFEGRAPVSQED